MRLKESEQNSKAQTMAKRRRESDIAICIEQVKRWEIDEDFMSSLMPGLPACVEELVLDYALHDHRECSSCDGFACWDGCDDEGCRVQDCCLCGMDLCDDCAQGDTHDASWFTCENCCATICGGCHHRCLCGDSSPFYDNNCSGC